MQWYRQTRQRSQKGEAEYLDHGRRRRKLISATQRFRIDGPLSVAPSSERPSGNRNLGRMQPRETSWLNRPFTSNDKRPARFRKIDIWGGRSKHRVGGLTCRHGLAEVGNISVSTFCPSSHRPRLPDNTVLSGSTFTNSGFFFRSCDASWSLQDAPAKVGSPPPNRTVQKSSRMCENASAIRDRRTLIRYRRQRRPRDSRLLERRTADVHEAPASIRFQDRPHIIVWRGARDEATLRGAKITIRPMISITGYARSAICLRLAKCRGFWVSRGTANSQRRMGRRDLISV